MGYFDCRLADSVLPQDDWGGLLIELTESAPTDGLGWLLVGFVGLDEEGGVDWGKYIIDILLLPLYSVGVALFGWPTPPLPLLHLPLLLEVAHYLHILLLVVVHPGPVLEGRLELGDEGVLHRE